MLAVDLHAHTRFFHGRRDLGDRFDPLGVRALRWAARRRGLDAVTTTNHDYYTPFRSGDRVAVLPGIEVSSTMGHVLVLGPDPPSETIPGEYTPAEVVDIAHERGCVAIAAHPYRGSSLGDLEDVAFDAIEINGKHPRTRPLVEAIAERWDVPVVAGSDAHLPVEVGRAYTWIDASEASPEAVVAAIREGRVKPRVGTGYVDRLMRSAYRRHHARKHPDSVLASADPTNG